MIDNVKTIGQQATWDASVQHLNGDLLQNWNWGEFKRRYGWRVERVASDSGSRAQILFRHYGPLSVAYIPRGPVFAADDTGDLELLHAIDAACIQHRAVTLLLEPAQSRTFGTTTEPDSRRRPAQSSLPGPWW